MKTALPLLILLLGFSTTALSADFISTKKLAEQGNVDAQFDLATMYDVGEGVKRDVKQAAKWYHMAAEQGEVAAQYNLAIMYDIGDGVEKDIIRAYAWMAAAEMFGYEGTKERSQDFLKNMTPDQRDKGEALVMEIVNRITASKQHPKKTGTQLILP